MVTVHRSTIIDAPVDEAWRVLRDFNGHDRWHPAVADSEIEGGGASDMIGAVRHFRLAEGGELREQLLSLSDKDRSFTYCILEAPFPLMNYVATVRLKPVTDGNRTFWEWRSTFDPPPGRREELVRLVGEGIYQSGFAAIRSLLSARPQSVVRGAASPVSAAASQPLQTVQIARENAPPVSSAPAPVREPVSRPVGGISVNAIVVDRHGGPDVLVPRRIDLGPPGPGEVRIRHRAIGVNFIDVYCRTGYFDMLPLPGIPGMEAAGVIEAVGQGVTGYSPGERVAYACPPVGAYAEARNMGTDLLVRLPDDISDEIAAATLLKGVTASFLLHDVHRLAASETVLIHAAAGGVGQLLVQWARDIGATVIATVSTDDKKRIVEGLGADHVVVYSREDFPDAVSRITGGRGVDVIYDAVGKDTFAGSLEALAVRGHIVSFGQASGPVGNWDIGGFASKSITLSRPNYGHYTSDPGELATHVGRFYSAVRRGALGLDEPTRYDLARAAEAHADLEARRTTGAIVLIP
jgi:NADPH:quinone reductase